MITAQPRPTLHGMDRPPSATPEPEPMEGPGSPKSTVTSTTMPRSLPPGWKREVVVRKNGLSAGKSDVYYYSPCGKKFRSKPQIAKFLGDNHNLDLSCFDFSRGAYGEVTQRRRARDRHITKKMETVKPIPVIKPLSVNPLRASGPVRRTCGVIKLPVTWVAPPDDDQEGGNFNPVTPGEQRSQIHNIVQSLWQNRLYGVKPYDHLTGDEIADDGKVEIKPITPMVTKPHSPRTVSPIPTSHPVTTALGGGGNKTVPGIVPFRHHHQQQSPSGGGGGGGVTTSPLLPTLLKSVVMQTKSYEKQAEALPPAPVATTPNFAVIQQTGQPIIVPPHPSPGAQSSPVSQTPSLTSSPHQRLMTTSHSLAIHRSSPATTTDQFSNGISSTKPPVVPVAPMVTERDLQLQEERVRLLRKQLLAAASAGSSPGRPSSQ